MYYLLASVFPCICARSLSVVVTLFPFSTPVSPLNDDVVSSGSHALLVLSLVFFGGEVLTGFWRRFGRICGAA